MIEDHGDHDCTSTKPFCEIRSATCIEGNNHNQYEIIHSRMWILFHSYEIRILIQLDILEMDIISISLN